MLDVGGLSTYYGNIEAVKGIGLSVGAGEIVALLGANGAGKTTTLSSITGLAPARRGTIVFDGQDITRFSPEKIASLGLIMVPEGRHIFPQLTVMENLLMGAYLRSDKQDIYKDVDYVLSLFPILSTRRKQAGGTLSGGEQQMLAISRALMGRPKMLLLDEPSLGLAPIVIKNIFQIIRQINQDGKTTILLVEQNANLALQVAHRAYILTTGRITLSGTARELMANEDVRRAYLGGE